MDAASNIGQITRTATIKKYVEAMVATGAVSKETFAANVVDRFNATYPAAIRGLGRPFRTTEDGTEASVVRDTNKKRLFRDLDSCLPANIEECVVAELSEPHRSACIRDLAARYNLSATPIPDTSGVASCKDVGRVMKECGEAIQAASSDANAREVVRESMEAIESLLALIAAHERPNLKVAG